MFKTETLILRSEQDGLPISLLVVEPEGEVRALVQLAHGMSEHKERYLPFMQYLAQRGYACAINDHRGHGASVWQAEDLGYFYENGDANLVEDMHQISLWMKARWTGRKLFLFGHSMGSLAARAYCENYDSKIDVLVLSGSPGENGAAGLGLLLVEILARLQGERRRSRLLQRMTVGAFARRFPHQGHPCAWISENMENVEAYERDPLCAFTFTLNGDRALLKLMRRAYALHDGRAELPVYFYSGAEDPCAPNEKGFQNAIEKMRRAGYLKAQGHRFSGMRHEILNETGRMEVFERIWREAFEANLP